MSAVARVQYNAEVNATEEEPSASRTRYRLAATLAVAGSLVVGTFAEWLHAGDDLPAVAPETPISETGASYLTYDAGVTKGGDAYVTVPINLGPRPPGLSPGLQFRYLGRSGAKPATRSRIR